MHALRSKKLHVLVVNADAVMKKWSDYSML